MKSILLTILATLSVSILAGDRSSPLATLDDLFITGTGANYPSASITFSSGYIDEEIAKKAKDLCEKDNKDVLEIYDVSINIKASYAIEDINGSQYPKTFARTYPVWTFSARVVCK